MNRYSKMTILVVSISISGTFNATVLQADNSENKYEIITQEQAAEHAAKLANEKCQKEFGQSPFTPGSYEAESIDSKWHWGKIEPKGINGYSAQVEFNKDGSDENVKVAFSTDRAIIKKKKIEK
jgi:hypothetical protein